ncbi:unnamed protein product [Rodentolepis nana]|uniref:Uncharacterized protein n=1 Tax=Rodentolepis nana TaxID=102285 RepID=A0A0R3TW63_RODNA|nr:unnamed protein product [Rodentolepis nana]
MNAAKKEQRNDDDDEEEEEKELKISCFMDVASFLLKSEALGGDSRFKTHTSLPRGEDVRQLHHHHHHQQGQSSSTSHLQRAGTSDSPGKFSL